MAAIGTEAASRLLTPGEAALVARVFGPAIDPAPVRLHRLKWWMWQPAWVTMAPDGHLWFHPNGDQWSADFSAEGFQLRGHFIHEMVHVWQHQQGIDLRFRRPPFARYRYLPLEPGRPFEGYGLEQQAEIVKEAYWLSEGLRLAGRPPLEAYRALLPFPLG
ncbi:MAG: vgr related protein [Sphingomonadaceae bacterium]